MQYLLAGAWGGGSAAESEALQTGSLSRSRLFQARRPTSERRARRGGAHGRMRSERSRNRGVQPRQRGLQTSSRAGTERTSSEGDRPWAADGQWTGSRGGSGVYNNIKSWSWRRRPGWRGPVDVGLEEEGRGGKRWLCSANRGRRRAISSNGSNWMDQCWGSAGVSVRTQRQIGACGG